MAKKTFNTEINNKHDIKNEILKMNAENKTVVEILALNEKTTKETIVPVIEIVKSDVLLTDDNKTVLINAIKTEYIHLFNFENCPEDYQSLKEEAKFLAGMTQYNFILMAQRLIKIRDNKLYEDGGYTNFKSFIDGEMPINKSTAYNYISILECFGVQTFGLENIEYTKLLPIVSILKSKDITVLQKENIKGTYIIKAQNESAREIQKEAHELKTKLGLTKTTTKDDIDLKKLKEFEKFFDSIKSSYSKEKYQSIANLKTQLIQYDTNFQHEYRHEVEKQLNG